MDKQIQYIKAGWMIDGSGAPVQRNTLLTIKDGIFHDISPFHKNDSPNSSLITDLSRCTILPPLTDCHVHLAISSATDPQSRKQQINATYEDCKTHITDHLHYLFSHGVLAVRDAGDRSSHALRYKRQTASATCKKDPVIIKTAGKAWHKKERYGAFIGSSPASSQTLQDEISKNLGCIDHIKIINSGINSLTKFGKETAPQFSLEELQSIASLATEKKKRLMIHANGKLPVQLALEAGCHSIEHGFFMGDENLKRLADTDTVWVPTAVTMKAILENLEWHKGPGIKDVIRQNLDHQLAQIAKAKQYGVNIAIGTDSGCSGVIFGESVVEELKLLIQAGYSLVEAIQCASLNGATLLGIQEIGLLKKGRPANFIVARATPAMLPRKLSYLEAIYLHGKPCSKAFFNKI